MKPPTRTIKNWENSKYCSMKCNSESKKGRSGYWLGKKRVNTWSKGIKLSEEHKRKMVEARLKNGTYRKLTPEERLIRKNNPNVPRGKNHYKWRGGITPEQIKIRNSLNMKFWREAIFKRDNWTCQECKTRGKRLNAHHIKPFALFPELHFAIDNGVTLCWDCHKKTPNFGGRVRNYHCEYTK